MTETDSPRRHHRRGHHLARHRGRHRQPRRMVVHGRTQGDRAPARQPRGALRLPEERLAGAEGAGQDRGSSDLPRPCRGLRRARIENEDDVLDVIELLRLNYDRIVEREAAPGGGLSRAGHRHRRIPRPRARAHARACPSAAGASSSTHATVTRSTRAVGGLDGVIAIAGDVADPDHRRRLVEAAGGSIDLLVNNASVLGPTPLPLLARLRRSTSCADVYEVNVLAPLALVQLALPRLADRRAHRQPQLRRGRRGVRDLGRLRLVQGRAGPPDGDPRAPRIPACARTPSTRATCARRCSRTHSPARTSPTGRRPRRAFPACWR